MSDNNDTWQLPGSTGINKDALYGTYLAQEKWKNSLNKKMTHKALDIPLDDDVNITQTKTGISTAGALGIAAMVGIPPLAILGYMLLNKEAPQLPPLPIIPQIQQVVPQVPQVTPQVQTAPVKDRSFQIKFYDKDRKPINVPQLPQKN